MERDSSDPKPAVNGRPTTMQRLRLLVCPTTGGHFQLSVSSRETIVGLKYSLARKLQLRPERMSLLHKNRLLMNGTLLENKISDGNHLTLVPNMETGTKNMKADSRVMQALESLTESQVNDFLTGRAPLLLAMKLGEHMMFVQLQLSASSCNSRRRTLHTAPAPPTTCNHATGGQTEPEKPRSCSCPGSSGAVIDSVSHLGQGVYSGTFSGTLDPTSSDSTGKPKRDINTILQILNDLLMASPQFRQYAQGSSHPLYNPSMHGMSQNINSLGLSQNGVANTEDDNLRGKVQSLKQMMLERKLRRQMRRGTRAPYSWSDRRSPLRQRVNKSTHPKYESSKGRGDLGKKIESHTAAAAEAGFQAPALEHEEYLFEACPGRKLVPFVCVLSLDTFKLFGVVLSGV